MVETNIMRFTSQSNVSNFSGKIFLKFFYNNWKTITVAFNQLLEVPLDW